VFRRNQSDRRAARGFRQAPGPARRLAHPGAHAAALRFFRRGARRICVDAFDPPQDKTPEIHASAAAVYPAAGSGSRTCRLFSDLRKGGRHDVYQYLLFDIDETLLDYNRDMALAFERMYRAAGLND